MQQTFSVIVEKDEDGWFVGSVPELPGCHTQARTREELRERVKEAILLYLETKGRPAGIEFVGVSAVEVTG